MEFEQDMKELAKLYDDYIVIPRIRKTRNVAYQKYLNLLQTLSSKYHMNTSDVWQSCCGYTTK